MKIIIQIIKEARKEKGFTQEQFAAICGITQAHYSRIESGKMQPGANLIEIMFEKLDIKIIKKQNHGKVNCKTGSA